MLSNVQHWVADQILHQPIVLPRWSAPWGQSANPFANRCEHAPPASMEIPHSFILLIRRKHTLGYTSSCSTHWSRLDLVDSCKFNSREKLRSRSSGRQAATHDHALRQSAQRRPPAAWWHLPGPCRSLPFPPQSPCSAGKAPRHKPYEKPHRNHR